MKDLVVHPIVLAWFPVLFLFAHNQDELDAVQLIAPLVVVSAATLLFWFLIDRLFGNRDKAAILVSASLLLVFSFGRAIDMVVILLCSLGRVESANDFLQSAVAQATSASIWVLFIALVGYLVRKTRLNLYPISQFLNVFALSLIVLVGFNWFNARRQEAPSDAYGAAWHESVGATAVRNQTGTVPASRPDIFYIILDEYARGDMLQEVYGVDNSPFYSHLREKGFYVADQSTSNYAWTQLSLASSLNSTYLDDLASRLGDQSTSLAPVNAMLQDNLLFRRLRNDGYKIVSFASGFTPTENATPDISLSAPRGLSGFENELLKTTPIPSFLGLAFFVDENDAQRQRIVYTFDHLADVTQMDGPVFTFAHVVAPHPPFIFGPHGEALHPNRRVVSGAGFEFTTILSEQEYIQGYRDQVIFITSQVQAAIDRILSKARRPTIIVVQADHGPGHTITWPAPESKRYVERQSILNAIYFYDGNYDQLYPSITPVNTFRVILGHYLGADFQLLEDRNYFSNLDRPYAFIDVTARVEPNRSVSRAGQKVH